MMIAKASFGLCSPVKLYPYLAKNGLYGYADEKLKLVIPVRYKSASTFSSTGFAVVADEHYLYGVINGKGDVVIPLQHNTIQLQVVGHHTLAWTERSYISRFRFWEWKFWPGFWSPSDRRLFDTEVKRSHVLIKVLETGQQIYSGRVPSNRTDGHHFGIEMLDETHFILDGALYGWGSKRWKTYARHIFGQINGGLLLQRSGKYYRLVNRDGRPVGKSRFLYQDSLRYRVGTEVHRTDLVLEGGYGDRVANVFGDEQGRQYVFPDFSKAFPSYIPQEVDQGLAADTLINRSTLISSVTGTGRFIFRWFDRSSDNYAYWMLDSAGNWRQDMPENNAFSIATWGGDILWPQISGLVPANAVEQGWTLAGYSKVAENGLLYQVTIRCDGKERMGLWDVAGKKWRWEPVNSYIRCLDYNKGYWTFRHEKEGKYGLYHLPAQQELMAPEYLDMGRDGMVSKDDGKSKYIRFYVDWDTQREYRDK